MSNFKVVGHAQPIGMCDTAIVILDLRISTGKLYRKLKPRAETV